MINFEYHAPCFLEETLSLLDNRNEEAKVLAVGTDLIVQMKDVHIRPSVIVDAKNVPELNRLEWSQDKTLHIGAAVPLSKIVIFFPVIERFGILHQACSLIGSVQIRNREMMGGNICNAAPSADTPPPLLCLGAKAVVAQLGGTHVVPLESFFLGPGHFGRCCPNTDKSTPSGGQEREIMVEPRQTLLDTLRYDLGLTGTKEGCGHGKCGSCTVLLDGKAVCSYLVFEVEVGGQDITTIEGLYQGEELHPLQQAFIDEGAVQCSFCTLGVILTAKALLDSNPRPTEAQVRQYIAGNLCCCTGYDKIVWASLRVA